MSTYRIHSGDTLSGIAARYHTTVSALAKANHIANVNLIYAGRTLQIPDGFDRPRSTPGTSKPPSSKPSPTPAPTNAGDGSAAFKVAMAHLGQNASSMKVGGDALGRAMDDWVPNNVNCANFVSGCLEAAGEIRHGEHNDSVVGLMNNLDHDPHFQRVSLANAKPGDVVSFSTGGGGHHVVMFAGWKNGKPQFIGSNNVNPDGSQKVTVGYMGYQILAIHHYTG